MDSMGIRAEGVKDLNQMTHPFFSVALKSVGELKGTEPAKYSKLSKFGVDTLEDLEDGDEKWTK